MDIKHWCTNHRQWRDNTRSSPRLHSSASRTGLLFHARWGHCQHPHQQNMPLAGTKSQSFGDKDEHNERLDGGPSQDNPPFGFRSRPATATASTCTHQSNVAAAPDPRHVHLRDGDNVFDDAGGALPTSHLPHWSADGTPSHLPWWSANGTSSPLRRSPCPTRASAGNGMLHAWVSHFVTPITLP